ncbi:3-oxoadipate enol-lactonase [Histidinibacterium aquaticum]|uniref:3-oxoadipate enol-lactonase n=1 Tax=Histidinibacterium aquaticum TaxID=2613962 RepID=A0A5J5GKL1_9RHOB|nr:3-oxoadipate enol-lactonase [Histidinibacterium aquaticum]KAA9008168.1 3-oxoadipate enol-lactonase [Histidinibacterium aquaticum]
MTDHWIDRGDVTIHARTDGPEDGGAPALVFSGSLGTDLSLWDPIMPYLPEGLRIVRIDTRGHGQSSVPPAPYQMGTLVSDTEAVFDALEIREAVMVGLSLGGMIAQALAVKRLDLLRGLVISNTAAKIGTPQLWEDRIAAIRADGLESMADPILERWFSRAFLDSPESEPWRQLLLATPVEGYLGCCAAIAGTDLMTPTSGLRLPTLAIAGSEDGATPPDLVRETADLIPGSQFELIRRAGHLPCVEAPEAYAELLTRFMRRIGHLPGQQ